MKTLKEAASWLLQRDDFLIVTHRRPDGDAVGSAVALCLGLRAAGKRAHIWENPQFTARFEGRLDGLVSADVTENTTVIAVDLATEGLLPVNGEQFAGKIELCLDHHPSNTGFAAETLLQTECAGCGELIWDLLLELGVKPDRDMAEAVYIAISTDSGCFRFANTTARTFRTAAACVEAGANIAPINREFFEIKSKGRLQLESRLMANMEFFAGGTVAIACLPQLWVEELNVTEDDLDSISGFPRTVDGVEVGVLIRDSEPGKVKMSVRTAAGHNASVFAAHLGGGGHAAAAGCSMPGTMEEGRAAMLAVLKEEHVI